MAFSGTRLASISPMLEELSKNRFQRQQGTGRLTSLFFLGMIVLLWAGGHMTYTALTNRQPTVMSYSDYARTRPAAKWLVLTNCELDLPHACVVKHSYDTNGDRNEYFIPVLNPDAYIHLLNPDAPIQKVYVVYKTADRSICAPVMEMDNFKTGEAARAWVKANVNRVFPLCTISGLVVGSEHRSELERLRKNLADDYIILQANAQPNLATGIGCSAAGVVMLFGTIISARKKS
jgi:hypothetical protein